MPYLYHEVEELSTEVVYVLLVSYCLKKIVNQRKTYGKLIVVVVRCEVKCRVDDVCVSTFNKTEHVESLLYDIQKLEGTRRNTYAGPD